MDMELELNRYFDNSHHLFDFLQSNVRFAWFQEKLSLSIGSENDSVFSYECSKSEIEYQLTQNGDRRQLFDS